MSKYKILIKISGSIAAYKSAYLISKLVQNGFEVKVVVTENALKFVGKAALEGLTGNPVYIDSFADGEMMGHINLMKWADLILVCPASANTINKLAAGIGDNLLTSLFLAFDWSKPYLIAPAMNTMMLDHPATKESLKKLESWGVQILPTNEGYLACGDSGKGKLLEPDEIYERILITLSQKENPKYKLNLLITAGGTKENIDGVRVISNLSTGNTAADIADYFIRRNHSVTYLHALDSKLPVNDCMKISYTDFNSLNKSVEKILSSNNFDAVIHNAAVSDYSVSGMKIDGTEIGIPANSKIDSNAVSLQLELKKNPKIIDNLKNYSINKKIKVAAFKFTNSANKELRLIDVNKLFGHSNCDLVILNDKNDRDERDRQKHFSVFNKSEKLGDCESVFQLAQSLEQILLIDSKKKIIEFSFFQ